MKKKLFKCGFISDYGGVSMRRLTVLSVLMLFILSIMASAYHVQQENAANYGAKQITKGDKTKKASSLLKSSKSCVPLRQRSNSAFSGKCAHQVTKSAPAVKQSKDSQRSAIGEKASTQKKKGYATSSDSEKARKVVKPGPKVSGKYKKTGVYRTQEKAVVARQGNRAYFQKIAETSPPKEVIKTLGWQSK